MARHYWSLILYYFKLSKKVKIGIKCSIAVPDTPQKTPYEIKVFFYAFILLAVIKKFQNAIYKKNPTRCLI